MHKMNIIIMHRSVSIIAGNRFNFFEKSYFHTKNKCLGSTGLLSANKLHAHKRNTKILCICSKLKSINQLNKKYKSLENLFELIYYAIIHMTKYHTCNHPRITIQLLT